MPDEANLDEFEQLDQELDEASKEETRFPTPSYGTGVHDQARLSQSGTLYDQMQVADGAALTGGDVDAAWEQADAVGDEAVGGSSPTPDMDVVDELGAAVGFEMGDQAFLRTNEILEQRDDRRWELDPASAEDYGDDG